MSSPVSIVELGSLSEGKYWILKLPMTGSVPEPGVISQQLTSHKIMPGASSGSLSASRARRRGSPEGGRGNH